MTTSVPAASLTPAGFSAPIEADILSGRFADFQTAFGGNLNAGLSTPQGQLASSDASIIAATNDLFLYFVSQVDPATASGRMQDGIARIYFLARQGALPTTVTCTCMGAFGVVIPAGALAKAIGGVMYQNTATVTIGSGGTVSAIFAAINAGPTSCPANTVTQIITVIPGWDSITNPSDGTVGRYTETRAAFEARRGSSVALNSVSILQSIRGALLNVSGVVDAYVTENDTGSAATVGGVSVAARSIYVAVAGGTDADVARAIWLKKAPGCSYAGATTVVVQDTGSGYSAPYPAYNVKFNRPAPLPIYFAVQISNGSDVPADAATRIRAAIADAFSGADGGAQAGIGATLFASRYFAGVASLGNWARIASLKIGTAPAPTSDTISVTIGQIPTFDPAHVTVTTV